MGLGGLTFIKNLLATLFSDAMVTDINQVRKEVSVVVEDMSIIINNIAPRAYSMANLKSEIQKHIPRTYRKFPKCAYFISLIDDSGKTPKAKKPTQKNRESRPHLEGNHIDILGDYAYLSNHGYSPDSEKRLLERALEKNLSIENAKRKKAGKGKIHPFTMYINRVLGTRSMKADVAHVFTRELLRTPVSAFSDANVIREFVVDGAVWVSETEGETSRNNRFNLVFDPDENFEGESDLDILLVNDYKPEKCFEYGTCAIGMNETGKPKLWDKETRPGIGEADIKIVSWLRYVVTIMDQEKRDDPEHKKRNLWVSCSDTDLIVILLLWAREMIDPHTGEFKHNLYLDCTSRKKSKTAEKMLEKEEQEIHKKYNHLDNSWTPIVEVYDICLLWTLINRLFLESFPGITNPVEVFCLLVISAGTDFVCKPPHLGMGTLWKSFCAGGYTMLSNAIVFPTDKEKTLDLARFLDNTKRPMAFREEHIIEFYNFSYI